mmetsp:Transcript_18004/g.44092  ORF Transcript_18004/g.44092 Transcript_18004/m.44092 type:complete len:153 (-) Transcript_18004:974-1432(-)
MASPPNRRSSILLRSVRAKAENQISNLVHELSLMFDEYHTIWRRYVSALGTILNIFNARWCSSQTYSTLPSRSGIHTKAASRIKNEVGLIWLRRQSAVLRAIICTFRTLNVLRCMSTLIIITWATIRCKEFGGEINGSNCESSPESPEHTQQ